MKQVASEWGGVLVSYIHIFLINTYKRKIIRNNKTNVSINKKNKIDQIISSSLLKVKSEIIYNDSIVLSEPAPEDTALSAAITRFEYRM